MTPGCAFQFCSVDFVSRRAVPIHSRRYPAILSNSLSSLAIRFFSIRPLPCHSMAFSPVDCVPLRFAALRPLQFRAVACIPVQCLALLPIRFKCLLSAAMGSLALHFPPGIAVHRWAILSAQCATLCPAIISCAVRPLQGRSLRFLGSHFAAFRSWLYVSLPFDGIHCDPACAMLSSSVRHFSFLSCQSVPPRSMPVTFGPVHCGTLACIAGFSLR